MNRIFFEEAEKFHFIYSQIHVESSIQFPRFYVFSRYPHNRRHDVTETLRKWRKFFLALISDVIESETSSRWTARGSRMKNKKKLRYEGWQHYIQVFDERERHARYVGPASGEKRREDAVFFFFFFSCLLILHFQSFWQRHQRREMSSVSDEASS